MPKSKLRGGVKAHNKRVSLRNSTLKGLRKKAQEEYESMFNETLEKLKSQYQDENGETTEINTDVVGEVNDINVTDVEVVIPQSV
jgi:hypothetical protein